MRAGTMTARFTADPPVTRASDAPREPLASALGRLLYLAHALVLLWWLLDRSPNQRASAALILLIQQVLASFSLTVRFAPVRRSVLALDALGQDGLLGDRAAG